LQFEGGKVDNQELQPLSVFDLAQLIWADAMARDGGHLTNRDMAKLTGIPRATWSKLMVGPRDIQPSPKTFMVLSAYLSTLKPPLKTESGFVVNQTWETLQSMDALYRRSHQMSPADAMAELQKLRRREQELLAIILESASDRSQ
jgi:hypothetical protein